jgi:hypothetical protein
MSDEVAALLISRTCFLNMCVAVEQLTLTINVHAINVTTVRNVVF